MTENGNRLEWLDGMKLLAILAVLVDHTCGILYEEQTVQMCSYFSVTLFVLTGGITAYVSCGRHREERYSKDIFRRLKRLLIPYAAATACYLLAAHGMIDLRLYLQHLAGFTASAPFYFLVFYLQLILIARPLYCLAEITGNGRYSPVFYALETAVFFWLAAVFIRRTYILPVWGGGQYLFGGTYFPVFWLGMLIGKFGIPRRWKKGAAYAGVLAGLAGTGCALSFLLTDRLALDRRIGIFGSGVNPPGISVILYTLAVFLTVWALDGVIDSGENRLLRKIRRSAASVGRYSLYIFLFHKLILDWLQRTAFLERISENIWFRRAGYLLAAVAVSVLFGIVIETAMGGRPVRLPGGERHRQEKD